MLRTQARRAAARVRAGPAAGGVRRAARRGPGGPRAVHDRLRRPGTARLVGGAASGRAGTGDGGAVPAAGRPRTARDATGPGGAPLAAPRADGGGDVDLPGALLRRGRRCHRRGRHRRRAGLGRAGAVRDRVHRLQPLVPGLLRAARARARPHTAAGSDAPGVPADRRGGGRGAAVGPVGHRGYREHGAGAAAGRGSGPRRRPPGHRLPRTGGGGGQHGLVDECRRELGAAPARGT
jgi:hypothetical protein